MGKFKKIFSYYYIKIDIKRIKNLLFRQFLNILCHPFRTPSATIRNLARFRRAFLILSPPFCVLVRLPHLSDLYLELSNNLAERCVKPFVVARKVFQTSGSEAGARHTVRLFSIIRTAIINGLDPYRYLEYALENVGRKPIEAILPYSKDLEIR